MRILAINSSPRKEDESKTALMLNHLVKGMRDEQAEVGVVNLREKKINYCQGCFTCWTRTPGRCVNNDDMTNELFPRLIESDLLILATPLYSWTVNANLKAFIDRTIPAIEPYLVKIKGLTRHPLRQRLPAIVTLSVAGAFEDAAFDQLSSWANFLYGPALIAEIYRTSSEAMVQPVFEEQLSDILGATEQAGRELVTAFNISPGTMARLRQPIIGADDITIANVIWQTCLDEGLTPKEMQEKGIMPRFDDIDEINREIEQNTWIPRPVSIENFRAFMRVGFSAGAAENLRAIIQFNFSQDDEGSCYLKIDDGNLEARLGTAEKPDLTIEAPFELWMDILTGKADGQQMLKERKYRADGDMSLLKRMEEVFKR
jgi:FMN-dependent NADH-azoreductase/putative sterol carrier protein